MKNNLESDMVNILTSRALQGMSDGWTFEKGIAIFLDREDK